MNDLESFLSLYTKYGFKSIQKNELCNFLCGKFSEIYVDVYADNPYTLLCRGKNKDVFCYTEDERLVISSSNRIILTNIPLSVVVGCVAKQYDTERCEILISVHNVNYKILIIK